MGSEVNHVFDNIYMRRRHRSGGRIMLRGKPGLIILVVILVVGSLIAYYTWAGSSSTPTSKNRFSKYGSRNKYPAQRNAPLKYGGQQFAKGPQMQNPPGNQSPFNIRNQFKSMNKMKPLEPPQQFEDQKGPKVDTDEDYKFNGDDEEDNFGKGDDFDTDDDVKGDPKGKDELKEKKFQQSDETKTKSPVLYPQLFVKPEDKYTDQFRQMEHIVHLDLKGAPPRIDYLISLMPLMKKFGATGLLVEYEDMFPYNNELKLIRAVNHYKTEEIVRLLNAAKVNGFKVIPLIQTFGHMEFVLKYKEYLDLRESPDTPQVITPTSLKTYELIKKMIEQIMTLHPDAPYLHIGCDEVYGLGKGKVQDWMKMKNLTSAQVFVNHVKEVASFIKTKYPKTGVIMWDDEIREKVSNDVLEKSGLGKLVELMVWSYLPHPKDRFPDGMWGKYSKYFNGLWAASSFKGATGSAQFYTNVSYHLENHINWVQIVKDLKDIVPPEKFRGFALTGWSRYDHFAALCELLPSAVPSLAVSLQVVLNGGFSPDIHKIVSRMLNCSRPVELDFPKKGDDYIISQDCKYPGSNFYYAVQQLWSTMDKFKSDGGLQSRIEGWLTDFHIQTRFSSPGHMKILQKKLSKILDNLQSLVEPVRYHLKAFYDKNTVEEWVAVHLTQTINMLKDKMDKTKILLQGSKTWDKRPVAGTSGSRGNMLQPGIGQQQQLPQQQQAPVMQQQQQIQIQQQQRLQQQQQLQQEYNKMKNGQGFQQGNNQGQLNNPLGLLGQQKNPQYSLANQGQSQNFKWQNSPLQKPGFDKQAKFGGGNQFNPGQQQTNQFKPFQQQSNQFNPAQQQAGQFNPVKPQAGFSQKPFGFQNSGMNGIPKQDMNMNKTSQQGAQQPKPPYQGKALGDGGFQMDKGMKQDEKSGQNLFGSRRTDNQLPGTGTGAQKNPFLSMGEKKKDSDILTEKKKELLEKVKQQDGLIQNFEARREKERNQWGNSGDLPGQGLRKGNSFLDLQKDMKDLKTSDKKVGFNEK